MAQNEHSLRDDDDGKKTGGGTTKPDPLRRDLWQPPDADRKQSGDTTTKQGVRQD